MEPTTEAGRRLLNEFGPENHEVRADILAIEAEARASQPLTLDVARPHHEIGSRDDCDWCVAYRERTVDIAT